jgi:hypothetical protein
MRWIQRPDKNLQIPVNGSILLPFTHRLCLTMAALPMKKLSM